MNTVFACQNPFCLHLLLKDNFSESIFFFIFISFLSASWRFCFTCFWFACCYWKCKYNLHSFVSNPTLSSCFKISSLFCTFYILSYIFFYIFLIQRSQCRYIYRAWVLLYFLSLRICLFLPILIFLKGGKTYLFQLFSKSGWVTEVVDWSWACPSSLYLLSLKQFKSNGPFFIVFI